MTARIRLRRADITNWDADNPTLDHGEVGLAYDDVDDVVTFIGYKVGNGADTWSTLPMNRPPTAGTLRSGLGDGDDTEGASNAPVSWDDIALLALTNNFLDIQTFKGGLVVDESAADADDAAATVQNGTITVVDADATITASNVAIGTTVGATDGGSVTVADDTAQADTPTGGFVEVAREIRLPNYDSTNDRDGVVSGTGASNPGGMFIDASGPFLANGGSRGQAENTYGRGPYVQAKDSVLEIGGKDASDNDVPIRYAAHPAADLATLNELDLAGAGLITAYILGGPDIYPDTIADYSSLFVPIASPTAYQNTTNHPSVVLASTSDINLGAIMQWSISPDDITYYTVFQFEKTGGTGIGFTQNCSIPLPPGWYVKSTYVSGNWVDDVQWLVHVMSNGALGWS